MGGIPDRLVADSTDEPVYDVSIIVPCHDSETPWQTRFPWPPGFEVLFQFQSTIASARNAGAARARGKVLAFCDADIEVVGDLKCLYGVLPDWNLAWTVERREFHGYDRWTDLGVEFLNLASLLGYPQTVGFMACHRIHFRPFLESPGEDVIWGQSFPAIRTLPLKAVLLRPFSGPLVWRERRRTGQDG